MAGLQPGRAGALPFPLLVVVVLVDVVLVVVVLVDVVLVDVVLLDVVLVDVVVDVVVLVVEVQASGSACSAKSGIPMVTPHRERCRPSQCGGVTANSAASVPSSSSVSSKW